MKEIVPPLKKLSKSPPQKRNDTSPGEPLSRHGKVNFVHGEPGRLQVRYGESEQMGPEYWLG